MKTDDLIQGDFSAERRQSRPSRMPGIWLAAFGGAIVVAGGCLFRLPGTAARHFAGDGDEPLPVQVSW